MLSCACACGACERVLLVGWVDVDVEKLALLKEKVDIHIFLQFRKGNIHIYIYVYIR